MKPESISPQRRKLMIAGATIAVAAAVMPDGLLAVPRAIAAGTAPGTAALPAHEHAAIVVSGRLTTADGKPLADATILTWQVGASRGANDEHARRVQSDADGRFMFTTTAPNQPRDGMNSMHTYVTHPHHATKHALVYFGRNEKTTGSVLAQTQIDPSGTLRASFAMTVG